MPTWHDDPDTLMLTGTVLCCPDCRGERIFVVPEPDEAPVETAGDYACTECGAAVLWSETWSSPASDALVRSARIA